MEAQARLRRLRRQTILSLAVASAAVLTGPASALGAGAGVSNGVLFFTGSGTEANRLTLSQDAYGYVLEDPGAIISTGSGCMSVTLSKAYCSSSVFAFSADLADGDDAITNTTALGGWIYGKAGADTLNGGSGPENLQGGTGDDALDGGDGDDKLDGNSGGDVLAGGAGDDEAAYGGHSSAVTVSLDGVAGDGAVDENDNVMTDVENIEGSWHADTLTGSDAANTIKASLGNDTLYGLAGDDDLEGSFGDDTLEGGDGTDTLRGNSGNDNLRSRDASIDSAECGSDVDVLTADLGDTTPLNDCESIDRQAPPADPEPTPTDPGTTDPGAEPTPTDPGTTGPGTEPTPTDPGTEPTPTDPGTEPTPTDPGTTDPGTEPTPTDPGTTDPGTEPTPTDPGTTDPGTEPTPTDPSTEPTPTDPSTEPTPTDPGTEPTPTDPGPAPTDSGTTDPAPTPTEPAPTTGGGTTGGGTRGVAPRLILVTPGVFSLRDAKVAAVKIGCSKASTARCRGTVTIDIAVPAGTRGTAGTARRRARRRAVIGRASFSVAPGGERVIKVKISRRGRSMVKRTKVKRARMRVQSVDLDGRAITILRSVGLAVSRATR